MRMKLKYRNITVPYSYYDKKQNYTYYIYKDKMYTNLNELFCDFVGSYLTYHYEVKGTRKEVHNLSEVLEAVIKNKDTFNIPKKYKEEYSEEEWKYIKILQKKLINNELKIEYEKEREFPIKLKDFWNRKIIQFNEEIYKKYKKVNIPKKIHAEQFKNDYFVVAGDAYESIYHALDAVYDNSLYYQFGGTKSQNNRTHQHSHSFDDLIHLIFANASKFKIHVSQREFYSKQELEFLSKLSDKLKKMKFHSVERKYDTLDVEEYIYLKEHKKYISLLMHNIRFYNADKKYQKEVLESHKV